MRTRDSVFASWGFVATVAFLFVLAVGSAAAQNPAVPALYTPEDASLTNDATPTFTWESTAGAGGTYTLEYSQTSDFSSGVTTVTDITGESYEPATALTSDGVWYWHVNAIDDQLNESGFQTTPFSFTLDTDPPATPTLYLPATGSAINDNTPEFVWQSTAGTNGAYTLEYSRSSLFMTGVTTVEGITDTTYTPTVPITPDATWFWRVKAFDEAGNASGWQMIAFNFILDTAPPDVPNLILPEDGEYTNVDTPTFLWGVTAGTGGTYTLEYSQTSDFSSGVTTVSDIADNSYVPTTGLTPNGVWYWHVKAVDIAGNESGYQTIPYWFELNADAPDRPTLYEPAHGSYINDDTPLFSWEATAGVNGTYTLEYSQTSDFSAGVTTINDITTESYEPVTPLSPDGVWYWHVQAIDEDLNVSGFQADPFSFTLDTEPPSAPELFTPPDGGMTSDETPQYSWESSAGTGGFYTLEYSSTNDFSADVTTVTPIYTTNYTPDDPLPDVGVYYWHVKATDRAGNEGAYQDTPASFTLAYGARLRVFMTEPESRWRNTNYHRPYYHYGFFDLPLDSAFYLTETDTFDVTFEWDIHEVPEVSYFDMDNFMVIAGVYNLNWYYGNNKDKGQFKVYPVDATAAARPGDTGHNIATETFTHTVLIEEGTGTWCPYCVWQIDALHAIETSGDYPFYYVAMVQDKVQEADDILDIWYAIGGYPTSFFDGGEEVLVGGWSTMEPDMREVIETAGAREVTPLQMSIEVDSIGQYSVQVHIVVNMGDATNLAPAAPDAPAVPDTALSGLTYTCSATGTDPEGGDIYFMFDFNGETTEWLGPYASGTVAEVQHTWDNTGVFPVKVQVKDSYGLTSDWSAESNVAVAMCGDCDVSGAVDIDDAVFLIAFIFSGGPPAVPYAAGDMDCSAAVDIDDVVFAIAYIFSGGPAPCSTCP